MKWSDLTVEQQNYLLSIASSEAGAKVIRQLFGAETLHRVRATKAQLRELAVTTQGNVKVSYCKAGSARGVDFLQRKTAHALPMQFYNGVAV